MLRAASPAALLSPVIIPLLCAGCFGPPALDSADAGKTSSYRTGAAGFDIETVQAQGDSLSALDLFLSIPFPSLIFEKAAGGFRARYEITARLSDRSAGQLVEEVSWAETTFVERYESTQSSGPIMSRKRIGALPGSYRVDVTLEDLIDARKASRAQSVTIADLADLRPALGRITLIAGKRDGAILPRVSFFVPVGKDSTGCTVGAYNFPATSDSRIELRVLRFAADTSAALPPFYFSILPVPLGHSLIDFDRPDTAYDVSRTVRAGHRNELLEFWIPPLRQGMYRIDVTAATRIPGGADTALSASRYYSIKGPGFPRPVTFGELIDAAVYIATDKEMTALRHVSGPEDQRKNFEAFWLSFTGDPDRASALIRKYYGRVEEANRLFTIVREGWRTDRGMLYCVLGPPAEVSNHFDMQTWYYSLSGNANDNTYVFKRVIRSGDGVTVEDYILYRQGAYETFWQRQVARWRSGEPL
ncbi:MAG TPA: GWxTD domain-containing protein [Bacteroidota bacterium]